MRTCKYDEGYSSTAGLPAPVTKKIACQCCPEALMPSLEKVKKI